MEIGQIILETILSFSIFYLTGNVFALFFSTSENPIQNVFFKLVGGVLFWILALSIYATTFKTIHILILPVLIFFWKKEGHPFPKIKFSDLLPSTAEFKYLLLCFFILMAAIGVQFYRMDYFNDQVTSLSEPDFSFYLTMAEYQFSVGIERLTPWFDLNELSQVAGADPYHFGDIWLISAFLQWSQLVPLKMFLFVFIPTIMGISFVGLNALLSMYSEEAKKIENIVICFLMLFSIGAIPFIRASYSFENLPMTTPKVFLFFIFSIVGFIFLLKEKHQLFAASFCLIPIFHILYAPLIFSAIFVWAGYFYFIKKEKWALAGLIFPILIAVGIGIFYFLFGKYNTYYDGTSKLELATYLKGFMTVTARDILARGLMFYLPILIFSGWVLKNKNSLTKNEKLIFSFSILLLLATIFFRGLLNYNHESLQIPQIVINPLLTILLLFIFSIFIKNNFFGKKYRPFIYVLLCFHLLSSTYILTHKFTQKGDSISHQFLEKLDEELAELPPIGVFISKAETKDFHSVSPHLCYFAEPLKMIGSDKWVNSISVPDDLTDFPFPERISSIANAPFFLFIQQEKANGNYTTYGKAQKDFVKKYKIGYVLIEKGGVVSKELASIISKIIEAEDGAFRVGIFE